MRTVLTFAVFMLLLSGCSREQLDQQDEEKVDFTEALKHEQIDEAIYSYLEKEQEVYNWENASLHLLWSAVTHGNDLVSIGYGENKDDSEKALSENASQMESDLLKLIAELENTTIDKIIYDKSELCNNFIVKIKDANTLLKLKNHQKVRYVEPIGYSMGHNIVETRSGYGCEDIGGAEQSDYTLDADNNRIPWNWSHHNIVQAQDLSYFKGKGIHISIIDTGLSPAQDALKSPEWTTCFSSGRSLSTPAFQDVLNPGGSQTDLCGHGTSMAAIATAPKSCKTRIPGVAYRANLKVYRAAKDVYLNDSDSKNAVAKAFESTSKDPKGVVSMSMGCAIHINSITDAINLSGNKSKLIFCAAGTTGLNDVINAVIFPALLDGVLAVTGILPKRQDFSIKKCNNCHTGSQVDFAVVMQKELSSGEIRNVPHVGHTTGTTRTTGGSSAATATMAGMAAVIWSTNKAASNGHVLNQLKKASQYRDRKNDQFGYGMVDAKKAVEFMAQ